MPKRKLTAEILETIERCASDQYTLEEIYDEADIARPLFQKQEVLDAIERGRTLWLIEAVANNEDLKVFNDYSGKSLDEINTMIEDNHEVIETYKAEIQRRNEEEHRAKVLKAKYFLSPIAMGASSIALQHSEEGRQEIDNRTVREELSLAVEGIKGGDTTKLLEILTSNIMQLHRFNMHVTDNLFGELGKSLPSFEKLSNMQLKVMQETRKNVMAVNEIINPKRTTFIKEANQHNHLHQNYEKKDENQNELQKSIEKPSNVSDTILLNTKEIVDEKKQ